MHHPSGGGQVAFLLRCDTGRSSNGTGAVTMGIGHPLAGKKQCLSDGEEACSSAAECLGDEVVTFLPRHRILGACLQEGLHLPEASDGIDTQVDTMLGDLRSAVVGLAAVPCRVRGRPRWKEPVLCRRLELEDVDDGVGPLFGRFVSNPSKLWLPVDLFLCPHDHGRIVNVELNFDAFTLTGGRGRSMITVAGAGSSKGRSRDVHQ